MSNQPELVAVEIGKISDHAYVIMAEYQVMPEMPKVGKGKYLQCAREMNHSELRRGMLWIADCYPGIFKTLLTEIIKR